jgi:serine/threonine-protein kinase
MGEVYEALQVQLARRVALKTIRADLASRPELIARFQREAESAAALGHPNLVQVTDFQALPGEPPFLVMEMLDGATLADVLAAEGRLDPPRTAFIGVQLLAGLSAAHRAGIVHRDVKPANIFLQSTTAMRDLVKVLDFGVAKLALDATPGAKAMTEAGQIIGTLSYMAPEQMVSGAAVDARTDIFGVGATLFHALSGVRPLEATEPGGGRTPLDRIAPWVSRELAAVIERALQKSPDARWSTGDEMAAALQPFAGGPVVSAAPSSPAVGGAPKAAGWNPAAIGRLEAPTGGGSSFDSSSGYANTGYANAGATRGGDPSMYAGPRDATLLGHGARAPGHHVAPPAFTPGPPPFASVASYGPVPVGPAVSASAPPGMVPIAMPQGYGPPNGNPYAQQSPYMQPPPHMFAPPRASKPWWLIIVAVVVLAGGLPYFASFIAYRNATNPDTIATNVEREVLKQPKQPCPQGDQCTQSRQEHGLTYPLCSRRSVQLSPYTPGELVLAGEDSRIAIVNGDLGGGRYTLRFLTGQTEATVSDEQIAGRLCRAGGR